MPIARTKKPPAQKTKHKMFFGEKRHTAAKKADMRRSKSRSGHRAGSWLNSYPTLHDGQHGGKGR